MYSFKINTDTTVFNGEINCLFRRFVSGQASMLDLVKECGTKYMKYVEGVRKYLHFNANALFNSKLQENLNDHNRFATLFSVMEYYDGPVPRSFADTGITYNFQIRPVNKDQILGTLSNWGRHGLGGREWEDTICKINPGFRTIAKDEENPHVTDIYQICEYIMPDPYVTLTTREAWDQIEILVDGEWCPGYRTYLEFFTNEDIDHLNENNEIVEDDEIVHENQITQIVD